MHKTDAERWRHDHVFAQDRVRPGESRTLLVVVITATMPMMMPSVVRMPRVRLVQFR